VPRRFDICFVCHHAANHASASNQLVPGSIPPLKPPRHIPRPSTPYPTSTTTTILPTHPTVTQPLPKRPLDHVGADSAPRHPHPPLVGNKETDHHHHYHRRPPSTIPSLLPLQPPQVADSHSPVHQNPSTAVALVIAPSSNLPGESTHAPGALSFTTTTSSSPSATSRFSLACKQSLQRQGRTVSRFRCFWSSVPQSPLRWAAARLSSAVARLAGYLPVRHTLMQPTLRPRQYLILMDCALTYLPPSTIPAPQPQALPAAPTRHDNYPFGYCLYPPGISRSRSIK
jgi:hypothetical protein